MAPNFLHSFCFYLWISCQTKYSNLSLICVCRHLLLSRFPGFWWFPVWYYLFALIPYEKSFCGICCTCNAFSVQMNCIIQASWWSKNHLPPKISDLFDSCFQIVCKMNNTNWIKYVSWPKIYGLAFLIRVILIIFAEWQDRNSKFGYKLLT